MKGAREVAASVAHSIFDEDREDAVAEAIQQAREDGARWALEQVEYVILNMEEGENVYPGTISDGIEPSDVRKVAP